MGWQLVNVNLVVESFDVYRDWACGIVGKKPDSVVKLWATRFSELSMAFPHGHLAGTCECFLRARTCPQIHRP